MQQPGLYFPFTHIRDDNWLKTAALYWPSINRLVPRGYRKHDTRTSQIFVANEILRDQDPGPLTEQTSWDLLHTLQQNANVLKRSYSLKRAYRDWDGRQWGYSAENTHTQELAWIHFTKFPRDVIHYLSENGLAQIGRRTSRSGEWIGVHPALAGAYMTVLANRLSETAYFQPLTDQADLRVATPTSEIQSALNLLLGPVSSNLGATAEGVETYVMLALQHVRPKDLGNVSAEKIIACREDLRAESQAFREYVTA